ncbi:hypothetical protein HK102_008354, partial [Quaeritorhiza haematococci]
MKAEPDRPRAGRFFQTLARALAFGRYPGAAWRFQSLTAIDALPDFDESFGMMMGGWGGSPTGAPVDAEGSPVYYRVPESFEKAANDGERWRWALAQSVEADAELLNTVRMTLGDFALSQFGPQTLGGGVQPFVDEDGDGQPDGPTTSIYALETLKDDETVARLASGVKRFALPDEFNPIKIYRSILDDPKTGKAQDATNALASLFQNRRQFVRAAEYWKLAKAKYGDPHTSYQQAIDQIEAPWGRFEPASTHVAGRGATMDFSFRNGRKVRFEAHRLLVDKLLNDVKAYIKGRPEQVDWQRIDVNEIGARIVSLNQRQYQGESVARWELDLDPPADHFDRRIAVTTPLQKAGAYLVTAQMEGGNVGRIVAWIDDTVLVRKPMGKASFYYAADALTGTPVAGASLELFGWQMRQIDGGRRFQVDVKEAAYRADAKGQVVAPFAPPDQQGGMYQWLSTARTAEGRLAYLGFNPIWPLDRTEEVYDQVRVFTVTDRPVYRPGGPVKFKFWVARSRYDQTGASEFAEREFKVEINNPKGEKVFTKPLRADAFGGLAGEYELPSDAALGMYYLNVANLGGGSFRVEEYKKPEFEVKVEAPDKPVALGEKVKATIQADYYFGGPVTQGTVKYKITRRYADDRWFPVMRWDWLYGSGYWWFAGDYAWYPGWNAWGTRAPSPWWWHRPEGPPEVVADAEVPIGPDGKVEIEIDTAFAKAAHPDRDHKYEVEAQVTDASRRTIVGNGEAEVRAQTLDRKPVVGEGTLKLLKVTYEADGKPVETPLESWPLKLDADGRGSQSIKAAEPGQYRISATVDDGQGHTIEGGYLLTVAGQGFNGASFRFDDLEIIPDKKDYKPGEKVRLLINTNRANSTVLLCVR